jgi:potassium-transporting ATPase potassium-binding subunit
MYGRMVGDRRQGHAILVTMAVLWLVPTVVAMQTESSGNPRLDGAADQAVTAAQPGGNMEGKEVRLDPGGSALLATGTMGTSAGVASSALDSYTPIGGLTALGPILLGEVSPGGVGSGLYAMLIYALLAVFIAGLMVGRTPEYLGKKITAPQITLVVLYLLVLPLVILGFSAVSVLLPTALGSRLNPGMHGLAEIRLFCCIRGSVRLGRVAVGTAHTGRAWPGRSARPET